MPSGGATSDSGSSKTGHPGKYSSGDEAVIALGSIIGFGTIVVFVFLIRKRYKGHRHGKPLGDGTNKYIEGHIDPFKIDGESGAARFTKPEEVTGHQTNATEISPPSNSHGAAPQGEDNAVREQRKSAHWVQVPAEAINQSQVGTSTAPDLHQLLENRVFRHQLIQILSEHIEQGSSAALPQAPRRNSDDSGLPEYRSIRD